MIEWRVHVWTDLEDIPPAILERLRTARRVMALTGAGVSAESGIPTFRGADGAGFWGARSARPRLTRGLRTQS